MPLRILHRGDGGDRRDDRRPRRHGVVLEPAERRELERAGWRTTLEYRENHVRGRDGTLLEVHPAWYAEAERDPARRRSAAGTRRLETRRQREGAARTDEQGVDVISAIADSAEAVWAALRVQAEIADVRRPDRRTDRSQRAS